MCARRKKRARDEEAEELLAVWVLCKDGCACGLKDLCPGKGLKRCEHCGDIKKTVCRKAVCVAKAAPLQLTYVPTVEG